MKCPNCGKDVKNDRDDCPYCGTKLSTCKSALKKWILEPKTVSIFGMCTGGLMLVMLLMTTRIDTIMKRVNLFFHNDDFKTTMTCLQFIPPIYYLAFVLAVMTMVLATIHYYKGKDYRLMIFSSLITAQTILMIANMKFIRMLQAILMAYRNGLTNETIEFDIFYLFGHLSEMKRMFLIMLIFGLIVLAYAIFMFILNNKEGK